MPSALFRRLRGPRFLSRRAARGAALVLAAVAAGACDDDVTGEDDEPEIQSVRLTVTPPNGAAATYSVTTTSNTAIPLRVGTSAVTAVALDANGQAITFDEPFQFRMVANVTGGDATAQTPLSGVLTFTPGANGTGTLTGTITATAVAAASTAWVRLVHVEEAHSDYDARVQVSVVP